MTRPAPAPAVNGLTGPMAADVRNPAGGFDWDRVAWLSPSQPHPEACSYCDGPIPDDSVPLTIWAGAGWTAAFCVACQARWWPAP
jgi:hypothetical protein